MQTSAEPEVLVVVLDDGEDGALLAALIQEAGVPSLRIEPGASQVDTVNEVLAAAESSANPVAVVDYRLDQPAEVSYRGLGVAASLRDTRPGLPLVLLTSDNNVRALVAALPGVESTFDWTLTKDEESVLDPERAGAIASRLSSLARGYGRLNTVLGTMPFDVIEALKDLLACQDEDLEEQQSWFKSSLRSSSPAQWGRWLLHELFLTPTPLLSEPEAAAQCGLTPVAFRSLMARPEFAEAWYSGVFQEFGPLVWRSRLSASLIGAAQADATAPLVGSNQEDLERALCTWCGAHVTRACAVCEEGTHEAHSLALDDKLGSWGLPLVKCFQCVARGLGPDRHVHPDVEDLAHAIATGEIAPSTAS